MRAAQIAAVTQGNAHQPAAQTLPLFEKLLLLLICFHAENAEEATGPCSENLIPILLLPSPESRVLPESSAKLSLAQGRAYSLDGS